MRILPRVLLRNARVVSLAAVLLALLTIGTNASAQPTFFDDFNDGNLDGWTWGYCNYGSVGNWRVEDGVFIQDCGADGCKAIVDGLTLTTQRIEADVYSGGGAGFTLWYVDDSRNVGVDIVPGASLIYVGEGQGSTGIETFYAYPMAQQTWHHLAVDADSETGRLDIWVDGVHAKSHTVAAATARAGGSGVFAGNSGGWWDNFTIYGLASQTYLPRGFYQPVDMGEVWNTVKGGATVPLKFEVFAGSTELTDTSVVQQLTTTQTACDSSPVDAVESVSNGGTILRYDTTAGQFVYNWKTPKTPGACYVVTVTLTDGSSLTAKFKLR